MLRLGVSNLSLQSMPQPNYARGGAKPRMLPAGARDILITIGSERKSGIYEASASGDTLARRVELPEWLSDAATARKKPFLQMFADGDIHMPDTMIAESQGHIFIHPPRALGFAGAAVGVDTEVWGAQIQSTALRSIMFYVYGTAYRLIERWRIPTDDFLSHGKLYDQDPAFMPQVMIELSKLKAV